MRWEFLSIAQVSCLKGVLVSTVRNMISWHIVFGRKLVNKVSLELVEMVTIGYNFGPPKVCELTMNILDCFRMF